MAVTSGRHDVVSFDMGWTLASPGGPLRQAYVDAITSVLGHATTLDEIAEAMRRVVPEQMPDGVAMSLDEYRSEWDGYYAQILRLIGVDGGNVKRGVACMWDVWEDRTWHLYDDAASVLDDLKALGYRLVIVSNWTPDLEQRCAALGLTGFEAILASMAVGYAKPHRGIFDAALRTLCVDPHRVVHVGDSLAADVVGATSAGIDAILVSRSDDPSRPPSPSAGEEAFVDGPGRWLGTVDGLRALPDMLVSPSS